jgi:septal ring factor EnvC (AmiA/AmiB activator)
MSRIRETTVELSWARDELTTRRSELANRLRYSYMHGRTRSLEMMLSAQSFADLLQRTAFMSRVLQQDKELIGLVQEREADVEEKLSRLGDQKKKLDRLQKAKEAEKEEYETLKQTRERDLAQVRDRREAHQKAAQELEVAAQRLERVLAELERKRQAELRKQNPVLAELDRKNFGKNRGILPWPVAGEVVTRFGRQEHPKYKTVTMSNGIDIAAPHGTPVRAVGDGAVDLVKWLPGYGETVILNHGNGFYTVYGHLSSVAIRPDDRVVPGQVIGAVGDTGSLKGAILHFELREKGMARDPLKWLQ